MTDPCASQPSSRHSCKSRATPNKHFQLLDSPHSTTAASYIHPHTNHITSFTHALTPTRAPDIAFAMSTSTGLRNNNAYLQPLTPIIGKPFILLPLYIYPAPGAWDPLYSAADAYPELEFWVVVNPANGPGAGALPDANYVDALVRLTALHNVKVIGYVHCSYGKRLAEEIVADVEAYGRWEGEMSATPEEGKVSLIPRLSFCLVPSFFFSFFSLSYSFFLSFIGMGNREAGRGGGREDSFRLSYSVSWRASPPRA